jgi:hypothetical protein
METKKDLTMNTNGSLSHYLEGSVDQQRLRRSAITHLITKYGLLFVLVSLQDQH